MTGKIAYLAGANAENQVAADYARRGHRLAARRWRGKAGEIDLIFSDGADIVFVEVKKAHNFSVASRRISSRQQQRICLAAEEYLGTQHESVADTDACGFSISEWTWRNSDS